MEADNASKETAFIVGRWYINQADPLCSGKLVRKLKDEVILVRLGIEFTVPKNNLKLDHRKR